MLGLPWHCFKKQFLTPLLESLGKVLYIDMASFKRSKEGMAKVKMQIDLTNKIPKHIWLGLHKKNLTIGRWKLVEYEYIPRYYDYFKH